MDVWNIFQSDERLGSLSGPCVVFQNIALVDEIIHIIVEDEMFNDVWGPLLCIRKVSIVFAEIVEKWPDPII